MKKLTQEERQQVLIKPPGRVSRLRVELSNLKPGESLQLEAADWKRKSGSPAVLCRRMQKKGGGTFKVSRIVNGNGWVIDRVK